MKKYYNGDRIDKIEATYKMLLGGRNIGKSYDVKSKRVLRRCYETGKEFTYLRRWERDIKTEFVKNYFADLNIFELTDGDYNDIYVYNGIIYFANTDENGKVTNKKRCGYAHALTLHERYKSQMFPNVITTIYEEFITDALYLPNEPDLLQDYVSTIYRERTGVVWLIGNTISKLCPYFKEWNLNESVMKLKPHEIVIFENTTPVMTEDGEIEINVKVAVEMCGADSVLSKMAFGTSASMIVKNEWKTKSAPKLDKDVLEDCKREYLIFVKYLNLVFRCELLNYKGGVFWYVCPFTKNIKDEQNARVIDREPSPYYLHTCNFYPLNEREAVAFKLIKMGKVFYCSNECGTDFQQVIKSMM